MRYGFYVSGKSSRLRKYLKQADKSIIDRIGVVFSDYTIESQLACILDEKKIDYIQIDYENLPERNRHMKNEYVSNKLLEVLKERDIDYCFSFGSHILSGKLLDEYKFKIINFHPAILPMFPGINAVDQAVSYGNVLLIGNTAHFIDSGVDTGPIIMQSVTPMINYLCDNDYDVILDMQIPMLNSIVRAIDNNDLVVVNGRVSITNANYKISHTYPEY